MVEGWEKTWERNFHPERDRNEGSGRMNGGINCQRRTGFSKWNFLSRDFWKQQAKSQGIWNFPNGNKCSGEYQKTIIPVEWEEQQEEEESKDKVNIRVGSTSSKNFFENASAVNAVNLWQHTFYLDHLCLNQESLIIQSHDKNN